MDGVTVVGLSNVYIYICARAIPHSTDASKACLEILDTIHGVSVAGSSNVYVSYCTLTTCIKSSLRDVRHPT